MRVKGKDEESIGVEDDDVDHEGKARGRGDGHQSSPEDEHGVYKVSSSHDISV